MVNEGLRGKKKMENKAVWRIGLLSQYIQNVRVSLFTHKLNQICLGFELSKSHCIPIYNRRWSQWLQKKKRKKVSTTYIPDDIAFSILSKLPIKSVKRFECVRKSWSLLSENHHFMNMFRNNLLSNSHRCPYYDEGSLLLRDFELGNDVLYSISGKRFENKVKLDFSNAYANRFKFRIFGFGSIDGTFCLYQDDYYGKTVLWNPSTHAIKLVSLPYELVESSIPNVDHFLSIHDTYYLHGFGYDNLRTIRSSVT